MSRGDAIHLHYVAGGRNAFAFRDSVGALHRKSVAGCCSALSWNGTVEVSPCVCRVQSDLLNEGRIFKKSYLYVRRGGSVGARYGFNQVILYLIPGLLWGSGGGSCESHRGTAPKLSSLCMFLKPSEEAHLSHPKWLCHHLYFCSNSCFNGFSELPTLKPHRKNNLNGAQLLLCRSNVIRPEGQFHYAKRLELGWLKAKQTYIILKLLTELGCACHGNTRTELVP